jgi:transposase
MESPKSTNGYVGIDISKDYFDVALPAATGRYRHLKLSNDVKGFKQLLKEAKDGSAKDGSLTFVMEASGPYYLPLASFLHQQGLKVSVVNPLVMRHYASMLFSRTKTDKKDAALIASYAQSQQPALWEPEAEHVLALKQLQTVARGFQKSHHQQSRQLESLEAAGKLMPKAKKGMERIIKQLEKELEKLEKEMEELVKEHYQQQYEQLKSIPGLGKKSSMLLIAITSGFTRFSHVKQLISYVGFCPRIFESGSSIRGKGHICKMGMSAVRKMLYVCSWSAIRCNKACKELYERLLAKGKAKKLALVAVANKLLKQAFAIATKKENYSENLYTKNCF